MSGFYFSKREQHGKFLGLEDFIRRTSAGLEQVIILIRVGALRFTGSGKKQLLWEAHLLMSKHKSVMVGQALFETESRKPVLPPLEGNILEDYYDEIELIGFCVTGTLFDLTKSDYRGDVRAADLAQHEGNTIRIVGDFVCEKFVKTKRGDLMKFGTFLDVEGRFFDTVHFPQTLAQFPLRGGGVFT